MHIEIVTFSAIAATATGSAATALAGDSLTVKNGMGKVRVLQGWAKNQTAGFVQVTNPSGHDTTRGLRVGVPAGFNHSITPMGLGLPVQPQELLTPTIAATAVPGDVELSSLLMFYENLPGVDARLLTVEQLDRKMVTLTTVEDSFTGVSNTYSGSRALNAGSDLLRANRDYAVLGATCRTSAHAAWMSAPDFGNVRVGVQLDIAQTPLGPQYFALLSRQHGVPCIPVINSGNKTSINCGVVCDENAGTFVVTWHLALLA